MIAQCLVVTVLVVIMCVMTARLGKTNYAISFIPLVFVPVLYIVGSVIAKVLTKTEYSRYQITAFIVVLALIISAIAFGVNSIKFKNKRLRYFYLGLCGGFSMIFSWLLLLNILKAMKLILM